MADRRDVEELADRIRPLLAGEEAVVERRMFGGIAFLVNGHLAVASSGQGGLMLRCPREDTPGHVERGAARMVMRGRAMDGWLRVEPAAVATGQALGDWVRVGLAYARSLPPKDEDVP